MILIFIGPPGSGKGTQADNLVKELGYYKISTGDIFRALSKADTMLAHKVEGVLSKGLLIDDQTVFEVVIDYLKQNDIKDHYILDGFPRTFAQAKMFDNYISNNYKIKVINFIINDQILFDRLSKRKVCGKCGSNIEENRDLLICAKCDNSTDFIIRSDDNLEIIKKRIEIYHQNSADIIDYYKKKNVLSELEAESSIENITRELMLIIN